MAAVRVNDRAQRGALGVGVGCGAAGSSLFCSILRTPTKRSATVFFQNRGRGFTLIELMVVVAIIALGSAVASLALRDTQGTALSRDAERLAALLESARAQSRTAGVPVQWRAQGSGFAWDGLPASASPLPTQWLDAQTAVAGNAPLLLGPDPIVAAQSVVLHRMGSSAPQYRVGTDGLRPFTVEQVQ